MALSSADIAQMDQISGLGGGAAGLSPDKMAAMDQISGLGATQTPSGFMQQIGNTFDKDQANAQNIRDQGGILELPKMIGAGGKMVSDIGGDVVSAVTPDIIKNAIGTMMNSDIGKLTGQAIMPQYVRDTASTAYHALPQPVQDLGTAAADTAKGLATVLPAVDAAKSGYGLIRGISDSIEGNPTIATRAAAGEVDKSVPALISQNPVNMTSDDLRAISNNIYKKADAAGGALSPDFTNKFVDDITKAASEHIKTPEDAAQAAAWGLKNPAADLISGAQEAKGLPMSLNIATSLDQKLGDLVHDNVLPDGKLNSSGREYSILQGKLRDAIKNAPPEQFVGGRAGFDASADARKAWMYQAQMRDLERIEAKAAGQEVGGNALRRGMYSYVTNPARSGSLEPSDFALAQKAGSKSITGEILKTTGSGLTPYVTTVLGSAGGIPGAAIGMGVGKGIEMGSKAGAEALQVAPLNALKKSLANKTLALAAKYK